jgi:hypothetical protein
MMPNRAAYARAVGRLRTILLLRAALVVFLAGVAVAMLIDGETVFAVIAFAAAAVNAALIIALARRATRAR